MPRSTTRVLVVSHAHPARSLGGAEIASYNLHKALDAKDGVTSSYLARAGHPARRHGATALMSLRQGEREFIYHSDDYDHFLLSNRNTEDIERDLVRLLLDLRPDVVHFHHVLGLGLEMLYAVKRTLPDAVLVVTFHEYLAICNNHGQMVKTGGTRLCDRATPADCNACFPAIPPSAFLRRERFVRSMLDVADHFVSPSKFLVDRFTKWGLDPDRFSVIENGLHLTDPAPPRQLPPGGRRARFGYFGQLTAFKGADVLLDAVARVPDSIWGDDAALMIFGGNLEFQPEAFREKIAALVNRATPRVRMCGAYQNAEMPSLLQSVDWMIMPSIWWENSPIVIQEAFFHGRPLICSNIGGMAEKIADGINGLHFRVGSPEDLADRMAQAMSTPDLWERLRDGRPAVLDADGCATAHLELYDRLITGKSSTGRGGRGIRTA